MSSCLAHWMKLIALGFGFAIGDPIISSTGIGKAPYAVALGFFIAALLLVGISDNKPSKTEREPWWEELRFGIAYIVNSRTVFRAIIKITILFSTIDLEEELWLRIYKRIRA